MPFLCAMEERTTEPQRIPRLALSPRSETPIADQLISPRNKTLRQSLINEARKKANFSPIGSSLHKAEIVQDVITALEKEKIDINNKNERGQTALHTSLLPHVLKWLLAHNADVAIKDDCGYTALHAAVLQDGIEKIKLLLAYKASPLDQSTLNFTPIDFANESDVVRLLIEAIDDKQVLKLLKRSAAEASVKAEEKIRPIVKEAIHLKYKIDNKPLLLHTEKDITRLAIYLKLGMNIKQEDADGNKPLHAVSSPEAVELFVRYGAETTIENNKKQNPLYTIKDSATFKKLLTEYLNTEADLNRFDQFGITPLQYAVLENNCDKVKILLDYVTAQIEKGNIAFNYTKDIVDKAGYTLLYYAKTAAMLNLLLEYGLDARQRNKLHDMGNTLLHRTKVPEIADALINYYDEQKQVPVDILNDLEQTPLHVQCAEEKPNFELLSILLSHFANKNAEDWHGRTPIFYAVHSLELVQFLVKNGADLWKKDNEGNTLLHYALNPAVIDFLATFIAVNTTNDKEEMPFNRWVRVLAKKDKKLTDIINNQASEDKELRINYIKQKCEIIMAGCKHLLKKIGVDIDKRDVRIVISELLCPSISLPVIPSVQMPVEKDKKKRRSGLYLPNLPTSSKLSPPSSTENSPGSSPKAGNSPKGSLKPCQHQ